MRLCPTCGEAHSQPRCPVCGAEPGEPAPLFERLNLVRAFLVLVLSLAGLYYIFYVVF